MEESPLAKDVAYGRDYAEAIIAKLNAATGKDWDAIVEEGALRQVIKYFPTCVSFAVKAIPFVDIEVRHTAQKSFGLRLRKPSCASYAVQHDIAYEPNAQQWVFHQTRVEGTHIAVTHLHAPDFPRTFVGLSAAAAAGRPGALEASRHRTCVSDNDDDDEPMDAEEDDDDDEDDDEEDDYEEEQLQICCILDALAWSSSAATPNAQLIRALGATRLKSQQIITMLGKAGVDWRKAARSTPHAWKFVQRAIPREYAAAVSLEVCEATAAPCTIAIRHRTVTAPAPYEVRDEIAFSVAANEWILLRTVVQTAAGVRVVHSYGPDTPRLDTSVPAGDKRFLDEVEEVSGALGAVWNVVTADAGIDVPAIVCALPPHVCVIDLTLPEDEDSDEDSSASV